MRASSGEDVSFVNSERWQIGPPPTSRHGEPFFPPTAAIPRIKMGRLYFPIRPPRGAGPAQLSLKPFRRFFVEQGVGFRRMAGMRSANGLARRHARRASGSTVAAFCPGHQWSPWPRGCNAFAPSHEPTISHRSRAGGSRDVDFVGHVCVMRQAFHPPAHHRPPALRVISARSRSSIGAMVSGCGRRPPARPRVRRNRRDARRRSSACGLPVARDSRDR